MLLSCEVFATIGERYIFYDFENVSGNEFPGSEWRYFNNRWDIVDSGESNRGNVFTEQSQLGRYGTVVTFEQDEFRGTVHYGFDLKTLPGSYFGILLFDAKLNTDAENGAVDVNSISTSGILNIMWHWGSHTGLYFKRPLDEFKSTNWKHGEWNHIDVIVDVLSDNYITWTLYVNDTLETICSANIVGGFKGLGWWTKDEDLTDDNSTTVLIDDMYICSYPMSENGNFERKMSTMLGSKEYIKSLNDEVHIELNDKIPWNEITYDGWTAKDFVVLEKNGERIAEGFDVTIDEDGRGFTIKTNVASGLNKLHRGNYKIKLAGPQNDGIAVKGVILKDIMQ